MPAHTLQSYEVSKRACLAFMTMNYAFTSKCLLVTLRCILHVVRTGVEFYNQVPENSVEIAGRRPDVHIL